MPLVKTGISMQSDMKLGWRPQMEVTGAPIPLYYEFEPFTMPVNPYTNQDYESLYLGPRYRHSLALHKSLANKKLFNGCNSYTFKEPPNMTLIQQIIKQTHKPEPPRAFLGMNPAMTQDEYQQELTFDSNFESGNLDMVIKKKDLEYDLFMRVDTNTKGHHQWFYFSVENPQTFLGKKVKFNIVNFTKGHSLYTQGMRVCISKRSSNYVWTKGGEDIQYKTSSFFRQPLQKGSEQQPNNTKCYFMMSFIYEFTVIEDKTFFSYCFPYDFSKLTEFIFQQKLAVRAAGGDYLKESVLCQSLGGVDVPMLTITSRLTSDPLSFDTIKMEDFQDTYSRISLPFYKKKKYVIICARVHPGESNSSYMMQGLIKYLLGNSLQARELRKRCVFKIIPMTNPDGVIIGNYRTNMAGNDLNRKYLNPDEKLHPTVCAIKHLVSQIVYPDGKQTTSDDSEDQKVFAFIDMHGHSRKKNVFIYGPYYPLHHDRYLKMRIIPKLLSEETTKFRFFSCKFRIERSKEKAARIVLWREFDITNCFTFEASFHGYLNEDRVTEEFTPDMLERMGEHLVNSLYEYFLILEEEDRQKKLKELNKKKKKKKNEGNTSQQQLMSMTSSESFSPMKKLKNNSTMNTTSTNAFIRQQSNKVTPRVQLGHIQEERDEEDFTAMMNNPNEPQDTESSSPKKKEELKSDKVGGGIRSLKQMFSLLRAEEHKKNELVEEEDSYSSSDGKRNVSPENRKNVSPKSPDKNDSGSDSDPLEGELNAKEQAELHSSIKGAIDQFQNYFNGDSQARRMIKLAPSFKMKKKKTVKEQRNIKSPLPLPTLANNKESGTFNKATKLGDIPPPPFVAQAKQKRSFQQMAEEQKAQKDPYQLAQKSKYQAIISHTNIELFSKQNTTKAPPQYTTIKHTVVGPSLPAQQSSPIKESRFSQYAPMSNPMIINKIVNESATTPQELQQTKLPSAQLRNAKQSMPISMNRSYFPLDLTSSSGTTSFNYQGSKLLTVSGAQVQPSISQLGKYQPNTEHLLNLKSKQGIANNSLLNNQISNAYQEQRSANMASSNKSERDIKTGRSISKNTPASHNQQYFQGQHAHPSSFDLNQRQMHSSIPYSNLQLTSQIDDLNFSHKKRSSQGDFININPPQSNSQLSHEETYNIKKSTNKSQKTTLQHRFATQPVQNEKRGSVVDEEIYCDSSPDGKGELRGILSANGINDGSSIIMEMVSTFDRQRTNEQIKQFGGSRCAPAKSEGCKGSEKSSEQPSKFHISQEFGLHQMMFDQQYYNTQDMMQQQMKQYNHSSSPNKGRHYVAGEFEIPVSSDMVIALGKFPSNHKSSIFKLQPQQTLSIMQKQISQSAQKSKVSPSGIGSNGQIMTGPAYINSAIYANSEFIEPFQAVQQIKRTGASSKNSMNKEFQYNASGLLNNTTEGPKFLVRPTNSNLGQGGLNTSQLSTKDGSKRGRFQNNAPNAYNQGMQPNIHQSSKEQLAALNAFKNRQSNGLFADLPVTSEVPPVKKKNRTSRTNKSFMDHNYHKNIQSSIGDYHNQSITVNNEDGQKHQKYQYIIDTLLADQYPIMMNIQQSDMTSAFRNML